MILIDSDVTGIISEDIGSITQPRVEVLAHVMDDKKTNDKVLSKKNDRGSNLLQGSFDIVRRLG